MLLFQIPQPNLPILLLPGPDKAAKPFTSP